MRSIEDYKKYGDFVRDLVDDTKKIVHAERRAMAESLNHIFLIDYYNMPSAYHLSHADFAKKILGLTPSQYFKRVAAARVCYHHQDVQDLVREGKLSISVAALLWTRLTVANKELIMANLPGMTKREAEAFLSRVSNRGDLSPEEGVVEIRVRLKESELKLLQRAREVLSANGKVPSDQEILVKGLEELLRKRDPMERAKRAVKRLENSSKSDGGKDGNNSGSSEMATVPSPGTGIMRTVVPEEGSSTALGQCRESSKGVELLNRSPGTDVVDKSSNDRGRQSREPIPARVKHKVYLRDNGQCTFEYPGGKRCAERTMLEVDHILMICRGGTNELGNLRLLCRNHNREMAERALGKDFMGQWVGVERTR